MALISRGINWKKVLADAQSDPMRLASALSQLQADLEDLDLRMEGGTNDLNQAQGLGTQTLLERGTKFLTQDLVTSNDSSVTIARSPFDGSVDMSVAASASVSARPFCVIASSVAGPTGSTPADVTYNVTQVNTGTAVNLASGTWTAPVSGTIYASATIWSHHGSGSVGSTLAASLYWDGTAVGSAGTVGSNITNTPDGWSGIDYTQTLTGTFPVTAGQTLAVLYTWTLGAGIISDPTLNGFFSGFYIA